jgi:holo-[acyl-carrier protein] synthase
MTEERPFFLASRFAAKEAFVKALGTGFTAIAPRNIEVVVDQKGQPSITLSEEDRQRLGLGEVNIHLSLAHEEPLALAFVVLELLHGQR